MINTLEQPTPYTLIGQNFSLVVLQVQFDISAEEAHSFQSMARIYSKGSTVIREGESDKTLYLIRGGTVGVFKKVGDEEQFLATIDAVNFVGEMSYIIDTPRSATVRALSDIVLVYAISTPNFSLILSNPKWADILLTRFCRNLYQANNNLVAANMKIHELTNEIELLRHSLQSTNR
jgi:CRP/FNR family cyclic AMP-dependent transcriptional regulator